MIEENENEIPEIPGDEPRDGNGENLTPPIHESQAEPVPEEISEGDILKKESDTSKANDEDIKKTIRRKSIISFLVLGIGFIVFIAGFIWITRQPKDPGQDGALKPLRSILNFNEKVNRVFFKDIHLAPQYPVSQAVKTPKVNGDIGMGEDFDTTGWVLRVVNIDKKDTMNFSLNDIKKLPKTDIVFNFKCIEGWSQITHWGGVRFRDFITYYKLATRSGKRPDMNDTKDLAQYAGFETPDAEYYVGLDMASAVHPQTLLCYEMNGKPLPYDQGAPLRLIVPVKYGVKSLKRIGVLFFSDTRPHDYWFEQGYDYDAAL